MSSKPNLEKQSKHDISKASTSLTPSASTENPDKEERMFHRLQGILPSTPYLLTFPRGSVLSVETYHPDQVNNWTEGTPFSQAEGELQYTSFIPRSSSNSAMFSRGAWEETEKMDTSLVNQQHSGSNTPTNALVKKKITLSAYKNKKVANGSLSTFGAANDTPTYSAAEETSKAASTAKGDRHSKALPEAGVRASEIKAKERSGPVKDPEGSFHSSSAKRYHY